MNTDTSPTTLYYHQKLPDGRYLVPRDPIKNLEWRIRCRERALEDKRFQDALWQACMDDPLFFCAFALWVHEPRARIKRRPFCLAGGTIVVTDKGPVPIEDVTASHRVWDGESWVSHGGALCLGSKSVILAQGVYLTSDHRIWTDYGWKMAREGYDRASIRLADGYRERWGLPAEDGPSCEVALPLRVREWEGSGRRPTQEREDEELRLPEGWSNSRACEAEASHECLQPLGGHDPEVFRPEHGVLASLRRPGRSGMRTLENIRELPGGHGGTAERADAGQDRPEWQLRAWQLPMGNMEDAEDESTSASIKKIPDTAGRIDGGRDSGNLWSDRRDDLLPLAARAKREESTSARHDREVVPVYDIINAGDRNAFTVLGCDGQAVLVHNCPWPHQEPVIQAMDETITEAMQTEQPVSLTLKKSRAQGGTYVYLAVTMRRALKEPGFTVGLVTRNESLVDSRVDDSAVMFKVAWMLDRLPNWMLPDGYERSMTEHVIRLANDSGWSGYAATGDVARGGRTSVFCFDEPGSEEFIAANRDFKILSSVSHVSNCIFLVSTFGVDTGVFYEAATDPDNPRVYSLSWQDNPEHSKNIYTVLDGVAKALRPGEQEAVDQYIATHPRELKSIGRHGHKIEGKVQSPWYNAHRLLPGGTPRYIARELDMDPRGAVGKCFPVDLLDRMKRECCKPPVWQGQPVFDSETLTLTGLITRDDGPLKLWFKPGIDNMPPLGPFTVGCDIALGGDGAYSSNSVAAGLDDRTGEQVMEYTIKGMDAIKFARVGVGLAIWLRNALFGWEDSGMSGGFQKEVEQTYYGNVFFRNTEQYGSQKKTRKPGWPCRDKDKSAMFENMALAMEMGKYIPRSEAMIVECGEYEWDKGKIIHAPTKNRGATEKNHGDRCIAGGGCWQVFSADNAGNRIDTGEESSIIPEYGSFLWREQQEQQHAKIGSPRFGIRDVAGW